MGWNGFWGCPERVPVLEPPVCKYFFKRAEHLRARRVDDLTQVYPNLDPCSKPAWGAELIGSQETAKWPPPPPSSP